METRTFQVRLLIDARDADGAGFRVIEALEDDGGGDIGRAMETVEARELVQGGLEQELLDALDEEVGRARAKFPANVHLLPALMEEVGELSSALLECEGVARVRAEALQVACVALRIAEEGCAEFEGWKDAKGQDSPQRHRDTEVSDGAAE